MQRGSEILNEPPGLSICGYFLVFISYLVVAMTMPFSLFFSLKVKHQQPFLLSSIFSFQYQTIILKYQIVNEYERAVILRLGRILPGGAKGPGLFFILPCIDNIVYVDLRTVTYDVPPQVDLKNKLCNQIKKIN